MPEKILVVEDEKNIQSLIIFKLKNSGFDVAAVSDGAQALSYLETDTADLIVLDLMMPVMSGQEVLLALKNNDRTRNIPVVILTARTLEREVIDGLSRGADDYIKKPFSPSELVARIRNVLARAKRKPS